MPIRHPGLLLAAALTAAVVAGAVLLITLDFTGPDGLARAWTAASVAWSAPSAAQELLERRLKGYSDIDLFATVKVPDSDLEVHTGTSFANARALADGRATERWCYVERDSAGSAVSLKIELGRQTGDAPPVFVAPSHVAPEQVKPVGLTPDALVDLAHRHCRFAG